MLLLAYLSVRSRKPSQFILIPQLAVLVFAVSSISIVGPFASPYLTLAKYVLLTSALLAVVASWQRVPFAEAARQIRRYTYWPAALAALAFSGCVIWQVHTDPQNLARLRQEESISGLVRTWAHNHPDGILALYKKQEATGTVPGGWP